MPVIKFKKPPQFVRRQADVPGFILTTGCDAILIAVTTLCFGSGWCCVPSQQGVWATVRGVAGMNVCT